MESRWSLSAVGNTWSEISRHVYQYGENDVVEKIFYQFGGGDDYLTYILVPEESTAEKHVMDTYWTGYEAEGADGRRIYYFSEHEVQPSQAIDQITNDPSPMTNKVIKEGQLFILRGDKAYTIGGQEIK